MSFLHGFRRAYSLTRAGVCAGLGQEAAPWLFLPLSAWPGCPAESPRYWLDQATLLFYVLELLCRVGLWKPGSRTRGFSVFGSCTC